MLIRGTFFCTIALSILHVLFVSLYLERLPAWDPTNTADVTPWYFVFCQFFFALWFGLKDVSLAYRWVDFIFQDDLRIRPLIYCGPLLALCFALLWLPAANSFIHPSIRFTVLMVLYMELHSVCVAVLPIVAMTERIGHVAGGVCAGLACYLFEIRGDLRPFHLFTTTCAFGAAVVLFIVGESLVVSSRVETAISDPAQFRRFIAQTMSRGSMKAAVLLWALQGFYSVVFSMLFYTSLCRCCDDMSSEVRALLVASAVVIPCSFESVTESLFQPLGKWWTMCSLLAARLVMGALMLVLAILGKDTKAHEVATFFTALLFLGRVLSGVVEHLQVQVLRDIADEDAVIFGRAQSMDVAVQRFLTAVSRPFQLLAIFVVFKELAAGGGLEEIAWLSGWTAVATSIPVLLVWRKLYNLHGNHLQFVHMAMRKRLDDDSRCV